MAVRKNNFVCKDFFLHCTYYWVGDSEFQFPILGAKRIPGRRVCAKTFLSCSHSTFAVMLSIRHWEMTPGNLGSGHGENTRKKPLFQATGTNCTLLNILLFKTQFWIQHAVLFVPYHSTFLLDVSLTRCRSVFLLNNPNMNLSLRH